MPDDNPQRSESGSVGRLMELLSPEPVLLYGIGSIVVLLALLGVGLAEDQLIIVIGAAVLLLLAALAAGTHVILRRTAAEERAHALGSVPEGIDVTAGRDISASGGAVGKDEGGAGGIRVNAGRDIEASDGGVVGQRSSSARRPSRKTEG